MKTTIYTILFILIGFSACYRVKPLNVIFTGKGANNITSNAARIDGVIISKTSTVTEHGHCYSTSPNPTLSDKRTRLGSREEAGNFSSVLFPLLPLSGYYARAYMVVGNEVIYGKEVFFDTGDQGDEPQVESLGISLINAENAQAKGILKKTGVSAIKFHGHCWALNPSPDANSPTKTEKSGAPMGEFTSEMTGLTPNTRYYVRAYVITADDVTFYGSENVFQTAVE